MYEIFVSVITKGGYKLADMLERIKTYAAEGKLTIEEMEKLEALAREKATIQDGTDMLGMLLDHETRLRALEAHHITIEDEPPVDENGDTIIADYVQGKWYYAGDVVMWKGEAYVCAAPEGVVCVWSPTEYPAYWELMNA